MLIPQKTDRKKQKGYAVLATTLFILCFYVFLAANSISDPKDRRVILAELANINLSDFVPKITQEERKEDIPDEVIEEVEPTEEEPPIVEQRIDLSELLTETIKPDLTANREIEAPENNRSSQSEKQSLQIEDTNIDPLSGIRTLRSSQNNLGINQRSTGQSDNRLELSVGSDLSLRSSGLGGIRSGGLSGGPEFREEESLNTLSLMDLSDFGADYEDIDPVINELITWTKENPQVLPDAVKRIMSENQWDNGFLSSTAQISASNRSFELLLMIKEEIPELHIFLIEQSSVTYLVDRGFQKESSYLRKGSIRYLGDKIVEVDSQMRPASDSETKEFYQIFLSWWNSMNP